MGAKCPHCEKALEGFIPEAAHQEKLNALSAQLNEQKTRHEAALAGAMEEGVKKGKAEMEGFQRTSQEDLALSDAGIRDPVGRVAFRTAYGALPEADRGKTSLPEWVSQLKGQAVAHQADPKKNAAPQVAPALMPYITPEPAQRVGLPNTERGATQPAGGVKAPANLEEAWAALAGPR